MCCSSQSYPHQMLVKFLVCGLLSCSWLSSSQLCLADSSVLPVVPQPVQWLSGPVDTALAGVADFHVPAGYRFTDAKGARVFLESAHASIPQGLCGLLSSAAGDWWMTFEYSSSGHVSTSDRTSLEDKTLLRARLKAIHDRQNEISAARGLSGVTYNDWELKPSYHPGRQFLDYAVRLEGHSDHDFKIFYGARFLGRQGVLSANSVRLWRDGVDAAFFKDILKGISFKDNQQYADFQRGDKVADSPLVQLITDGNPAQIASGSRSAPETAGGVNAFWIALAVIGCVGITGGFMIAKKLRRHKTAAAPAQPPQHAQSVSAPIARAANGNGSKAFKFTAKPKPLVAKPITNGNGHSARNGQTPKRKRIFNYHKFYTEMVLQGPAPSFAENTNGSNGYNGHDGDQSRYQSASASPTPESMAPQPSAVLSAHSELIASQKALIEEQKRLIHEQARFIEEKSKLIAEKNQLLDRQSQMIDNNLV
jgi:uncharacterized membrane-anchored protein